MEINTKYTFGKFNYPKSQQKRVSMSDYRELSLFHESDKKYLVNFAGLSRTLGKRIYIKNDDINGEIQKKTNSLGIVGNLPSAWIKKIPQMERKEKIKHLYKDLNFAVNKFREDGLLEEEEFFENIQQSFINFGITNKKPKIEYLDRGFFSKTYKISYLPGESVVMKVFDDKGKTSNDINIHGTNAEINRAQYWMKNAGKNNQRVRFYFGDTKSGYMITKFIPYDINFPKKNVNEVSLGLKKCWDENDKYKNNTISGYAIDYGGMEIGNDTLVDNKIARYVYTKIGKSKNPDETWTEISKNPKFKNNIDVQIGLITANELTEDNHLEYCKELYQTKNIKLQNELIKNLDFIPFKNLTEHFLMLSNNIKDYKKIIMAKYLKIVNEEDRAECFKSLAKDMSSEGIKLALANYLRYIPLDDREKCFNSLNLDNYEYCELCP